MNGIFTEIINGVAKNTQFHIQAGRSLDGIANFIADIQQMTVINDGIVIGPNFLDHFSFIPI